MAKRVERLQQLKYRRRPQLRELVHLEVVAAHQQGQPAVLLRHAQACAQCLDGFPTADLVARVPGPLLPRREGFAEVVHQGGKAHLHIRREPRGLIQHQHGVHAGVDLRMHLGGLRHAEQRVDLPQHAGERTALAQAEEETRGRVLPQGALELRPHAFGHQCVHFALVNQPPHQGHGSGRDGKAHAGVTCSEPRHPQHAHRVLGESRRDVAQHPLADVRRTAEGVDESPVAVLGDGVYRQVAAFEVVV